MLTPSERPPAVDENTTHIDMHWCNKVQFTFTVDSEKKAHSPGLAGTGGWQHIYNVPARQTGQHFLLTGGSGSYRFFRNPVHVEHAISIFADSAASHRRPGRPRSLLDVHTGGRVWQCLVCAYTTKYRTNMKNHERIHTGERPHKCHVCGKAFMQKGNLVTHLRIHTGERPFQCHLCHITFKQKINLATHMGTHTNSCSESTK
ncbi:hypothetical protein MRX96_044377 [Rhipicephalus microplus]